MNMDKPAKILFIDDEPAILSVLCDYLQIVHQFEVTTKSSGIGLIESGEIFNYECLIIDYDMPDINGIALIKQIREVNKEIPIIVFTGKSREDVVIDAINSGADNFFQKTGKVNELFAELAHAIENGVRRYRAETLIKESEGRYRTLVEDQTEFICRLSTDGTIIYANKSLCSFVKKERDELIGSSFFDIYPDEREHIFSAIESCDPDNRLCFVDLSYETVTGSAKWQTWSVRVEYDREYEVEEILLVGRDITIPRERQRQDGILQELWKSLANSSSTGSVVDHALNAASQLAETNTGIAFLRDRYSGEIVEIHHLGKAIHALRNFLPLLYKELKKEKSNVQFLSGDGLYLSLTDMRRYDAPFLSVALIPIMRFDEIIGWFALASDTTMEIMPECRDSIRVISSNIGDVISRIEAEEDLRDALLESEERYMQLSESSHDAIGIISNRNITYLNQSALTLFNVESLAEFIRVPFSDYIDNTDGTFNPLISLFNGVSIDNPLHAFEGWLLSKNGRRLYCELIIVPISHCGELASLMIIKDKTEIHEQELEIMSSEQRFREMADLLPEPLFEADVSGIITFCNISAHELSDKNRSVVPGNPLSNLIQGDDHDLFINLVNKTVKTKEHYLSDFASIGSDDVERYYRVSLSPILDRNECVGIRGVLLDISSLRRTQDDLKRIIEEKDVLFREIHHRVKNNMQVIASLLQLQEEYIDDERVLDALHDCEQRISSLALVHQTLYRTDSLVNIPFRTYLENLTDAVISGYATVNDVRTKIDVGDNTFNLDTAVTLGLIINEMLINSMKYAFVGRSSGIISLKLKTDLDGFVFEYRDDGVGLPEGFNPEHSGSLGIRLIRILPKQILGRSEIISHVGEGFSCIIHFPDK